MTELKPCPFCGSENVTLDIDAKTFDALFCSVLCEHCGARGPCVACEDGDAWRRRASVYWNRRPPAEPDQSWLREAVERVLRQVPEAAGSHHKQKIAEAVGLELARAHARARHELRKQVQPKRGN